MSKLNPTAKQQEANASHLNWMGGNSWDVNDPFVRLRMAAASCFFGEPKYYDTSGTEPTRSQFANLCRLSAQDFAYLRSTLNALSPSEWRDLSPRKTIERCVDECLAVDPERTLQIASALRNEDFMRSTPQVILVRAALSPATKGTGLVRRYAPEICRRGDEPAAGFAYFLDEYGRKTPLPNALKKAWRDALESFDDYVLAKYRLERNAVKTVDVVNLTHAHSESIDRLKRDELRQKDTWESVVSNGGSWRDAAKITPHMATLRNLRNFAQNGVAIGEIADRLRDGVRGGKQLPFRYYAAYKALDGYPAWQDLAEECLEISFANAPRFKGRVASLSDNSGSAWGTLTSELGSMHVAEIGNLMGVIAGKCADEGWLYVFGDRLARTPVRKNSSVFDLCDKAEQAGQGIGGATENGIWLFFDRAIRAREHWDHIFVYSDMQAGHGGLYGVDSNAYADYRWNGSNYIDVAKLIRTYRERVNPNVMIYLVQTAGYVDALVPEYYDRTFVLGGWSTNILKFADAMNRAYDGDAPSKAEVAEAAAENSVSADGVETTCDDVTQTLKLKTLLDD